MDSGKKTVRPAHPRATANILSAFFFVWVWKIFKRGLKKELEVEDLFVPLNEHKSDYLGNKFERAWEEKLHKEKKPSLLQLLVRTYGPVYCFYNVFIVIMELVFRIAQPLFLGQLIRHFEPNSDVSKEAAYLNAVGLIVCSAVFIFVRQPYMMEVCHLGMKMRVAVCSLIYRKSLRLSHTALGETTVGQVVNLLSNDVSRLDFILIHLCYLILGPVQAVLVTYFMWNIIGVSSVLGVLATLLFIPLQGYIGKKIASRRLRSAIRTDERVRLMNEIISGIQVIKMYTWEIPFSKVVADARKNEIHEIRITSYLRAIMYSFQMFTTRLTLFFTLLMYVLLGNDITAEKACKHSLSLSIVFVVASFFNIMKLSMTDFFPRGIANAAEGIVSIKRIQTFLSYEELASLKDAREVSRTDVKDSVVMLSYKDNSGCEKPDVLKNGLPPGSGLGVTMSHVTTKWFSESVENTLTNINLTVKPGRLLAVIGPVGAGKVGHRSNPREQMIPSFSKLCFAFHTPFLTSVLHTMLRELPLASGSVTVQGKISYAAQEPWLFAGSVRNNILFGESYDRERYREVVRVCALRRDLELLPHGDKSVVGERGISLSGGQRARINLASNKLFIKRTKEYRSRIDQKVSTRVDSDSSLKKDRPSLIDSMIQMIEHNERPFSRKEIIGEINWTIMAGLDTTSTSLSFTMMLLGFHQDVQRKVQEELDAVFGDDVERSVSMEDLNNLKYIEQVIKESLRLYPVVPFVPRTPTEDIKITNHTIPKGCDVMFNIYSLHRNPKIYPNPDEFDPENFSPERSKGRHPYSFLPFSGGLRKCVGYKYAMLQIKVVLATVLRHFIVHPALRTDVYVGGETDKDSPDSPIANALVVLSSTAEDGEIEVQNLFGAVYKKADIYILDDPLSAVDAHVGKHLFEDCITGFLRQKTCILVTHQLQFLSHVDHIVILKHASKIILVTLMSLSSRRCPCPHACVLVLTPVSLSSRRCPCPHACVLVLTPVSLSSRLCPCPHRLCPCPHAGVLVLTPVSLSSRRCPCPHVCVLVLTPVSLSSPRCPCPQGSIEAEGTYSELQESGLDFAKLLGNQEGEESDNETMSVHDGSLRRRRSPRQRHSSLGSSSSSMDVVGSTTLPPEEAKELRTRGKLNFSVYGAYFSAGGSCFAVFFMFFVAFLAQVLSSGTDYWLSFWTDTESRRRTAMLNTTDTSPYNSNDLTLDNFTLWKSDNGTYATEYSSLLSEEMCIYIFAALTVATVVAVIYRSMVFFTLCMKASINLHNTMFKCITRVPMRFFNINPSGQILNRFSNDMGAVDEKLPLILIECLEIGFALVGILTLVAFVNYWILLPTGIILVLFYVLRSVYVATSRSVKRLEGITRSPVFSHLNASLQGLSTIRAFEAQKILEKEFDGHQDLHSTAFYLSIASNRAFGMWLDVVCLFFVTCVTLSFLVLGGDNFGGDVGLAISQSIGLTGMFQWGMRQSAELENQMTSVERVREYSKLDSEPALDSEPGEGATLSPVLAAPGGGLTNHHRQRSNKPAKDWPTRGKIVFSNISLRYSKSDPPVLKNLNFTIDPCEKIGIVGRTGAGKSSLISALFRLANTEGSIIIDNIDTGIIGLHNLRAKISIIPQEPVLFSGTLRNNLDPFEEYSDSVLWNSLEEVELKEAISELPAGLNHKVSEGGSNFSVGQRQLVCLARAIIRNNRILVMDEATANVDPGTDALIQKTVRRKFADCTVLTIAHRLLTVMDSDRTLVMDAGNVVELDHPYLLMKNKNGFLYNMVQETGKSMAETLYKIAELNYKSRSHQKVL
uniref:Uncharacterized protein n=1 Tax=Timema bartmani TaxID=61472 RepID=A0A7R9EXH6_9NEOP|nr:unnamed protein product [Timema bartmani]